MHILYSNNEHVPNNYYALSPETVISLKDRNLYSTHRWVSNALPSSWLALDKCLLQLESPDTHS